MSYRDATIPLYYRMSRVQALQYWVLNTAITHYRITWFFCFSRCSVFWTFVSVSFYYRGDCHKFQYSTKTKLTMLYTHIDNWYRSRDIGTYAVQVQYSTQVLVPIPNTGVGASLMQQTDAKVLRNIRNLEWLCLYSSRRSADSCLRLYCTDSSQLTEKSPDRVWLLSLSDGNFDRNDSRIYARYLTLWLPNCIKWSCLRVRKPWWNIYIYTHIFRCETFTAAQTLVCCNKKKRDNSENPGQAGKEDIKILWKGFNSYFGNLRSLRGHSSVRCLLDGGSGNL